ncbi:MAG: DUF1080 domain-containing protein [Gemmatimonadota bacterium]|nr:DUF1080 domain-containing protein [Gemmatimonadota bacterium]
MTGNMIVFLTVLSMTTSAFADNRLDSEVDYGRARIGGMKGWIHWEPMLHGEGLKGWTPDDESLWSREGNTVIARAGGQDNATRLVKGDSTWSNYELKVQVMWVRGANVQIRFGITDQSREYMVDYLGGWKAMAISTYERGKRGVTKLDVVNLVLEPGREYDLVLAVRGRSVTTYVDGRLVNRLTLEANPKGAVALGTWGRHAVARFRDPKIRLYNGRPRTVILNPNQSRERTMQVTKPARRHASFVEITRDPNLPDVLLIGDSISMGYTIPTRERLKGRANVHRPPRNCGPTSRGLAHLEEWLGTRRWNVIHFNWGLHDLKYVDDEGRLTEAGKGRHFTSVNQYKENLGKLVSRLKTTGAKLIWATTTPVPAGAKSRQKGDAATYNAAAKELMNQPGISTNDLYAFALPRLQELQLSENVHFTQEGSKRLADQVARAILNRLSE